MQDRRLGPSSSLITIAGFAATLAFIGLIYVLSENPQSSTLFLSAATGCVASLTAGLVIVWSTYHDRHKSGDLIQAEHDARHDALTGLHNRIALFSELENSVALAKQNQTVLGVMFLDLDRFKVINDSMGHDAGDELLRIVANRLKRAVRSSDVVARFGGDEFVVVTRDLRSERAVVAVAEQILKSFAEPVSLLGAAQVVSTSIGVAIAHPDDTRRPEDLVRDADVAMYKAKRTRSGYAVFDEVQRLAVMDRLDIERDLVKAIDEEQLLVYYQPLVDVKNKRLYGFEALIRWNHPTRGLIGPGAFLAVAEETGMMGVIGNIVLREACAQAAVWNHLSPDARNVKMSVNVAEQQLLDTNFPALVQDALNWSGLPAEQLVLEIVEDTIVDHLADGLSRLREINALGVSFAIDDFGTGQSSLSYVKQFDMVSTLKIDKTFVDEMAAGQTNRAIIEMIVTMAKALDLRVVAEGVEHEEQARELLGFDVDIMQGYLFNEPIGPDSIDPARWFQPRQPVPTAGAPIAPGLTSLQVSRNFVDPTSARHQALLEHARPPRKGN